MPSCADADRGRISPIGGLPLLMTADHDNSLGIASG